MKKMIGLVLCIVLMGTMFVMTGCTKQATVVLTVDGFETDTIKPASIQNMRVSCSKEVDRNGIEPTKYTLNGMGDGDYSMLLVDMNGASCPFTLRIHNGQVEVETPDGVTVTATVK